MRLSTHAPRDEAQAVAVIHAALDAGATLLDTSDAYALDESDVGHNERLVAAALASWAGERSRITVATKGGMRRPGGKWVPDGRARHLREACEASCRALNVSAIDLYQLHVVDPRVSLTTSVRALAALQREGLVRRVGLCNVNVSQIEAARAIVEIAAVQVSLSVLDDESLRNGVAEYCRDHDIMLLAHRPLGGDRSAQLEHAAVLRALAVPRHVSPHIMALACLRDLSDVVVPIPGATRITSANAIADVLAIELSDDERAQLDVQWPAGRFMRVPRAQRRPVAPHGDVVLVMGMPGAGKSTIAAELVAQGYHRLNRDEQGGRVAELVPQLDDGLRRGEPRWVLDNTYATRSERNRVIEAAWARGAAARCIVAATPLAEAQINAIDRMIGVLGHLPMPEELRTVGRTDPRCFGPDAQFRYERQLEPPVLDEGFEVIEERPFVRQRNPSWTRRALIIELDGVLCVREPSDEPVLHPDDVEITPDMIELVRRHAADGWLIAALAWRPQLEAGTTTVEEVQACFARVRSLLGVDIDIRTCAHAAGPPVCWCRKPLPGLVRELAFAHRLALEQSILMGRSAADRTLAARLGMTYR